MDALHATIRSARHLTALGLSYIILIRKFRLIISSKAAVALILIAL